MERKKTIGSKILEQEILNEEDKDKKELLL